MTSVACHLSSAGILFPLSGRAGMKRSMDRRDEFDASSRGSDLVALLEAVARGDRGAFSDLYRRTSAKLYGICLRLLPSEAEAQDVVQETFIVVAKKMPEFEYDPQKGRFRSWLIHTTQWRVFDQLEKRKRFPQAVAYSATDDETSVVERIPEEQRMELDRICDEEWTKNLCQVAINKVKQKVSAKQFQIFELCVVKEWPIPKVAQLLGMTHGPISTAKHRVNKSTNKT